MSLNIAREASEVLSFTSNLIKRRVRFGPQSIFSNDESSSSTSSTSQPTMPCHAHLNKSSPTKKRGKPTLNEFRALVKLWKHGMINGDAEFVANRYSPSAILSCDDRTFRGREAIQEYYQNEFFPKHHPKDIKVLYGHVAVYGEQVHDNGVYDITTKAGKFLRMKYTFVYARDSTTGRWRIVHHKTAQVCHISTSGTPIDNHATHRRSVQLEDENADSDSDDESFDGAASTASSEVIPWGSFPYEQSNHQRKVEEEKIEEPCHATADRAAEEERQESGWNQTTREERTVDASPHKRSASEIDRLVALLTGTQSINNLVVLNVNQGDMEPIERDDDVPNRRPSQVDHLVGLLTGTKSVTQNDLILLSVNNNQKKELTTDVAVSKASLARMRAQ